MWKLCLIFRVTRREGSRTSRRNHHFHGFHHLTVTPERAATSLEPEPGHRYLSPMEIKATFVCSYCLQINEIVVDGSGGLNQEYIEDCQICCRPNNLVIAVDEDMHEASVEAEQS